MKPRYAWISAALSSSMAGTALGQQTYTYPEPGRQNQSKQVEEAQRPVAKHEQASEVVSGEIASPARTSRRLYGIQVDSIRVSALDKNQVTELQQALQEQGYYTAAVDGVAGPRTKLALRQFYLDQAELASQGRILPQGAASLGLAEAGIERVRGEEEEADIEHVRGEEDKQAEQPVRAPGRSRSEPPRGPTLPMNPEAMESETQPVPKR